VFRTRNIILGVLVLHLWLLTAFWDTLNVTVLQKLSFANRIGFSTRNSSRITNPVPTLPVADFAPVADSVHSQTFQCKPRIKRDQSFYAPFSGKFWQSRPKAVALLEKYVKKARNACANGDAGTRGLISYRPSAELGNQIMGSVSAFLTAVLTDRYFEVQRSTYHSSQSIWDQIFNTSAPGFEFDSEKAQNECSAVYNFGEQSAMFFRNKESPNDNAAFPFNELACSDLSEYFNKEGQLSKVEFFVNQYFVPLLVQNPHYKSTLYEAFGDNIFNSIGRFLLRPSNDVANIVDTFRRENFDGKFVIGIHVRLAWSQTLTELEQMHLYWEAALEIERQCSMGPDQEAVWYVAGDRDTVRDAMVDYGKKNNKKIVMFKSVFSTTDIIERMSVALIDILLLAEADKLVTSSWSTYSYWAVGLAGIPPIVVTKPGTPQAVSYAEGALGGPRGPEVLYGGVPLLIGDRTTFKQTATAEPCFHFYFNWRAQDVPCFSSEWVEHEYFNGTRYC